MEMRAKVGVTVDDGERQIAADVELDGQGSEVVALLTEVVKRTMRPGLRSVRPMRAEVVEVRNVG